MTAPPFTYYGGKTRLAAKIASLLPTHEHYIEPFAGSLAVLLTKKPSRMGTVNDLDGLLMTFWQVLRDKPAELARVCALTPHSRAEYLDAHEASLDDLDDVERARLVWGADLPGARRDTAAHLVALVRGSGRMLSWDAEVPRGYVDRMAIAAERLHPSASNAGPRWRSSSSTAATATAACTWIRHISARAAPTVAAPTSTG